MSRSSDFLFVIASLLLVVARCNSENHWIIVHYHKTGHDLARKLAQVFNGKSCKAEVKFHFERRVNIRIHIPLLQEVDIAVLAAPDIPITWNDHLLEQHNVKIKFVHFVRDPFDMVMSGYLYHGQEVSPALEKWLKLPEFNPCSFDHHAMYDVYGKVIGESIGQPELITELISGTITTCEEINSRYDSNNQLGYNARLRLMSREDGALLEAARSILSKSGGDILRMATNALYEQHTLGVNSLRVFLPEFSVGNKTQFVAASKRLYSFLMSDPSDPRTSPVGSGAHNDTTNHFWSCLTEQQAIERSVELAYVASSSGERKAQESHITQGVLTPVEKAGLRAHLMGHPAIGSLLMIVQEILNK